MPWLISPTNVPPVAQQVHELIFLELMCRSKSTVIEAEKYLLEVILEMEWVFVFCIDATLIPYLDATLIPYLQVASIARCQHIQPSRFQTYQLVRFSVRS